MAGGKAGFHKGAEEARTRQKSGSNSGKLGSQAQPHQSPIQCPECTSQRVWKDGLRYLNDGRVIQRWLCRDCGFRFSQSTPQLQVKVNVLRKPRETPHSRSEMFKADVHNGDFSGHKPAYEPPLIFGEDVGSHGVTIAEKDINSLRRYTSNRRVSVRSARRAKNLAEVESRIEKWAAGATKLTEAEVKGLIAQYAYWLEKEGYNSSTYLRYIKLLARKGANLLDPEDVKAVIAKQPWKDGTKMLAVYAYDIMAAILKIQWTPPKYTQEEILPFIPEERELDALIAACRSKRMTTYLQALKETFADPGEVLKLRWIDIDSANNTITINRPVKGHNPRQLKVSSKLVSMLNALPKTSERVFPTTYDALASCFLSVRKRAARLLQNPRLLAISFRTFRHWGATMTFHYTKNLLLVKKLLGHKQIQSTMKYTQLVQFKDDEFEVTTATTVEEAKEVLAAGFDYVAEKDGIMLFRKPKRFGV